MKRLLILLTVLLLAGCNDVAVSRHFPEVPADLLVACPDLELVDPNTTKLSEVVGIVAGNYSQYQECRLKVDAWIEWYKTQQQIFDSVQ